MTRFRSIADLSRFWRQVLKFYFLASPVIFCLDSATADVTHESDLLIGSRATGVAGAYTAVSDDVSSIHYNPAGLGFIEKDGVSVSGYAYSKKQTRYEKTFGKQDFVYRSNSFVPSFIGGVKKLSADWVVAFALFTSTSEIVNQEDEVRDAPELHLAKFYNKLKGESLIETYALGVGHQISQALSAGISLGIVRILNDQQQYTSLRFTELKDTNGGLYDLQLSQNTSNNGNAMNAMIQFGIMVKNSVVSWGTTLRLEAPYKDSYQASVDGLALPIDSTGSPIPTTNASVPVGNRFQEFSGSSSGKFIGRVPIRVRTGISLKPDQHWRVSGDVAYVGAAPSTDAFAERRPITNIAVGVLFTGLDSCELSGGYFTNKDSTESISSVSRATERIDYQGFAAGVGGMLEETRIDLSVVYQVGKGESRAITVGDLRPIQSVSSTMSAINLGITRAL